MKLKKEHYYLIGGAAVLFLMGKKSGIPAGPGGELPAGALSASTPSPKGGKKPAGKGAKGGELTARQEAMRVLLAGFSKPEDNTTFAWKPALAAYQQAGGADKNFPNLLKQFGAFNVRKDEFDAQSTQSAVKAKFALIGLAEMAGVKL